MARIRTIKPECWRDPKLGRVSTAARLLWVVLLTMSDDEGRFEALPMIIVGHGYPRDSDALTAVPRLLDELRSVGLIVLYEADGEPYGFHPAWHENQTINRPSPARFPAPDEGSVCRHDPLTDRSEREGKGEEGRGEEGKGNTARGAVVFSPDALAVCKIMEDVGLPFGDPSVVGRLIDEHPEVDVPAAAERCAEWAKSRSGVRHPLRALKPFVTAADAPKRKQVDPALARFANVGVVDDGSGS